jgi:bifunctional oligoribonuclease and PAP phosphatase NrnA
MNFRVPQELTAFIRKYAFFIIAGHREPDGDCVASQLALASILKRLGKETICVSPGPFTRPEIAEFADRFALSVPKKIPGGPPAVLILDSSTFERVGDLAPSLEHLPQAVIDHHSSGKPFGTVSWVEPGLPATAVLVCLLAEELAVPIQTYEAELLLFGIATDTGFFRHLEGRSGHVFDVIARLTDAGASPKETYLKIFGNRSIESRILLGLLLARVESLYHGKLLMTFETLGETEQYGIENRDSDTLYMLLQGVEKAEAVALVREEREGGCSVGLRSNRIDVGEIAREFGGGGHVLAAGFSWEGPLMEIYSILKERFGPIFAADK